MKKKKMVIKVQINCDKCRCKAMGVAAKHGADSVAVVGEHKDLLVVTGDHGIDPAKLVIALRKKLGHAKIVSVEEAAGVERAADDGGKKGEARPPQGDLEYCCCCSYYPPRPLPPVVVVHGDYDAPQPCSIM